MDAAQQFFLYASLIASACLVAGLFKPWMMLWWEDRQNRKKVIRVYGTAALLSFVFYQVIKLYRHHG